MKAIYQWYAKADGDHELSIQGDMGQALLSDCKLSQFVSNHLKKDVSLFTFYGLYIIC